MIAAFRPSVHGIDGAGYYSWLRSFVIQGSLDTEDELRHFEARQRPELQTVVWEVSFVRLPTGLLANHYPVGSAVLWAPFFLVAHLGVKTAALAGLQSPADGYSGPYVLMSTFGSVLWAFAGLTLLYRIASKRFGHFQAGLAIGSVWLATPLVFYMYVHPSMSHANDLFVNALFLYVWLATRGNRNWRGWLCLGLVAGLAAMVRLQNGLLVVFPSCELMLDFFARWRDKNAGLGGPVRHAAAFVSGSVAAFLPQMIAWKAVFGSYLLANPQQASAGLGFDFTGHNIVNALSSTDRGLFVWSPITMLGLLGIFLLFRTDRRLAALLLCNFFLQLYLIGSWVSWNGAVSFGPRFFLNSVPAFAIGLACLLNSLRARVPAAVAPAVCAVLVLWNFGLMAQYVLQLIPRSGEVSLRQMAVNQFTAVPASLPRLLKTRR